MSLKFNPNLVHLWKTYNNPEKAGAVLEGSSRSGKTWSGIDFLIGYCDKNRGKGKIINIFRETYNSFKKSLYDDFNARFEMWGLPRPCITQDVSSFKLFGNKINFIGADKTSKIMGAGCDVLWLNEAIHIPNSFFDQSEMRCREFWFMDYNPEDSEHWIYDKVIIRPDVAFLRTTFLNNPFCPPLQRRKILSYNPNNPENVKNGTADAYMWDVFGLGVKAEKKGRIYPNVHTFEQLPDGATHLGYSGDWGYNHPTVVVSLWIWGNELYVYQVCHSSELSYEDVYNKMNEYGIDAQNDDCVFDSEDPRGINYLRQKGLRVFRAYKKQGWVMHTIKLMKELKIHVHRSSARVLKDFEAYCWKWDEKTDKPLDVPAEEGKDSCDAVGYGVVRFIHKIHA